MVTSATGAGSGGLDVSPLPPLPEGPRAPAARPGLWYKLLDRVQEEGEQGRGAGGAAPCISPSQGTLDVLQNDRQPVRQWDRCAVCVSTHAHSAATCVLGSAHFLSVRGLPSSRAQVQPSCQSLLCPRAGPSSLPTECLLSAGCSLLSGAAPVPNEDEPVFDGERQRSPQGEALGTTRVGWVEGRVRGACGTGAGAGGGL